MSSLIKYHEELTSTRVIISYSIKIGINDYPLCWQRFLPCIPLKNKKGKKKLNLWNYTFSGKGGKEKNKIINHKSNSYINKLFKSFHRWKITFVQYMYSYMQMNSIYLTCSSMFSSLSWSWEPSWGLLKNAADLRERSVSLREN